MNIKKGAFCYGRTSFGAFYLHRIGAGYTAGRRNKTLAYNNCVYYNSYENVKDVEVIIPGELT